jgi:hypothetical protein
MGMFSIEGGRSSSSLEGAIEKLGLALSQPRWRLGPLIRMREFESRIYQNSSSFIILGR